jgi:thiamine-monophosphate kinase
MEPTIGDAGEFGVIARVSRRLPQGDAVLLGPGDDAALLAVPAGAVLASTDVLVEGNHFRRDWSTGYDVGRKAAAQNLADIAAMGGRGSALLVGLVAPADLPLRWLDELADGLADEAAVVGASVIGGDTVRGHELTVAVTALGVPDGSAGEHRLVTRAGARPGDVLAVAGWLGWSAAGLALLAAGIGSPRALIEAHRRPEPPYQAGPEAARLGATAMIDTSDGLLADLGHIAAASRVRVDVRAAALRVPSQLRDAAVAVGATTGQHVRVLDWVLTGGEDHALAATFPPGVRLPARWTVIGSVRDCDDEAADGGVGGGLPAVTVDGEAWHGATPGWDHFR